MKINKKFLQTLSAYWILCFHVWINVTDSPLENYLIRIGYIGVDLFFFLSAYSLADMDTDYLPFVKSRFSKIYGKFFLFTAAAAIIKHWAPVKILKTLLFIDLFENGGGSFLWFLPAILLFYLWYPLFVRMELRHKSLLLLAIWFLAGLLLNRVPACSRIFIFYNRLPVLLAAYEVKKHRLPKLSAYLLALPGFYLLYRFGFQEKLSYPFTDFYYIFAILPVLFFVRLSCLIPAYKLTDLLGSITLELYGLQMIIGTKTALRLYRLTKAPLLTNLLSLFTLTLMALILFKAGRVLIKTGSKKGFDNQSPGKQ